MAGTEHQEHDASRFESLLACRWWINSADNILYICSEIICAYLYTYLHIDSLCPPCFRWIGT